ncbi:MAG: DUF881 domain-containing protein [Nocardioidaceae bacterium]
MTDQTPEAPEKPAPADGRDRLFASLRRPGSRGQLTAGFLLALLGFAAVTQVKANDKDDLYVGARQGDLIQYINNLSLASQRAENEIVRLQQTRDALQSDTRSRRTAVERAQQQADTLGILAGTVPVVGPGVVVTVTDPKGAVGSNQLLEGLEELRDAGAEAIELNDRVRVIAQTSLKDADGGVIVDGTLIKAPFTIEAIGSPHDLSTALEFKDGFVDEVQRPDVDGTVATKEADKVEITTVTELTTPQYASQGKTG